MYNITKKKGKEKQSHHNNVLMSLNIQLEWSGFHILALRRKYVTSSKACPIVSYVAVVHPILLITFAITVHRPVPGTSRLMI